MIDNITSPQNAMAFNPFKVSMYTIENGESLKNVCDYVLILGKRGVFGEGFKKIATETIGKVKDFSKSKVGTLIGGVAAAETFFSLPSTVATLGGLDSKTLYINVEQAETIGASLKLQVETYSDYRSDMYNNPGFESQLSYCICLARTAIDLLVEAVEANAPIKNGEHLKDIIAAQEEFEDAVTKFYILWKTLKG